MWTVSQAVEESVMRSPFLLEVIGEKLGNNAKIARRLKVDVEKKLLRKVSQASIAMALHRLERRLPSPESAAKLLKRLNDITVRSNLIAFVYPNSANLHASLEALSQSAARKKDAFLNFSRGLRESLFIISAEFEDEMMKALKNEPRGRRTKGLSAITMKLPEESLSVPGLYHPILKAIALDGISLVEVMSVRTEFSIIFEDKDVDRAFSIIKRITG